MASARRSGRSSTSTKYSGLNSIALSIRTKYNLGKELSSKGKYQEALRKYEEALVLFENSHGSNHQDVGFFKESIATTLYYLNELEKSLAMYLQVIESMKSKLGPTHPETLTISILIANVFHRQMKYSQAMEIYREVIELTKERLRGCSLEEIALDMNIITAKHGIALIWVNQNKPETAIKMLEELLEIMGTVYDEQDAKILALKTDLAWSYCKNGESDKCNNVAKQVFRYRKDIRTKISPSLSPSLESKYPTPEVPQEDSKREVPKIPTLPRRRKQNPKRQEKLPNLIQSNRVSN